MVLLVISSRSEYVAVNAAQAYEFVAGILCIIFFSSFLFSLFFVLAPFCSYILFGRIPNSSEHCKIACFTYPYMRGILHWHWHRQRRQQLLAARFCPNSNSSSTNGTSSLKMSALPDVVSAFFPTIYLAFENEKKNKDITENMETKKKEEQEWMRREWNGIVKRQHTDGSK